ncbi:MAG: neutral zinc metallopeptidase [Hahellaceae bacterium]|nr:neutral zinc metallopeptidase [Hahellaceae bacterium]
MRWEKSRQSSNIEDRRGRRLSVGRRSGIGGVGSVVAILVALYFGVDPQVVLTVLSGLEEGSTVSAPASAPAKNDPQARFIAAVLGDTEDTWHQLFARAQRQYQEPRLVLFSDQVQSACGQANAAVGPFYCPADRKVYLDLSFFRELDTRFGAPGDFAQAYVVAHEVGHHVQTLLGISAQVQRKRQSVSVSEGNALSVRQELQADCFAGVWAHYAQKDRDLLEAGDIEEGLAAAAAVGDDRLQRKASGRVVPESFTHGTSAQRVRWFREGFSKGTLSACDTFKRQI